MTDIGHIINYTSTKFICRVICTTGHNHTDQYVVAI